MILYAESSAVLAWLLGEPDADGVRRALADAEMVVASELTLVECDRVVIRAVKSGGLLEAEASRRQGLLARAADHWTLLGVGPEVVARARRPFPVEPVRTLDALHLATALAIRAPTTEVVMLALDRRVRDCARRLGFVVLPDLAAESV